MSTQKLHELIKDVRVAMFTTVDAEGALRSRPLTTVSQEAGDGTDDLWFFVSEDSANAHEVDRESRVNLSYAEPKNGVYVSVSGVAEVVRDPVRMRQLWKPVYLAFFPEGLDDPNLALMRVRATQAEYWDAPGSKVVNLIGMAAAIARGKAYRPGENEKVRMERPN